MLCRATAQVFPRAHSHPPRLLQELEALLVDRLRTNDRLASTSMLLAKGRDPNMAANLSLDGHRQVWGCAHVQLLMVRGIACRASPVGFSEQAGEGFRKTAAKFSLGRHFRCGDFSAGARVCLYVFWGVREGCAFCVFFPPAYVGLIGRLGVNHFTCMPSLPCWCGAVTDGFWLGCHY